MGEVSMNTIGLLPNICLLFNNNKFSDVLFVFSCDNGQTERMYGHKLILALRSKTFASMLYCEKEALCEVRLPASKKSLFAQLLRFLYTDTVQFHTFEEAQELYELAVEYAVEELTEKCSNYILHESLTIDNIFPKYECALRKNMCLLLKDCQDFVCDNSQLVFESVNFNKASVEVVEDIVKQNHLSVSSELDVINAVLKWGLEEIKRRRVSQDEKYLRECINPLLKHIRFLTLSCKEFDYFVENFNIFTCYESSKMTLKIYHPETDVDFPESLCSIHVKRTRRHDSKSMTHELHLKNMSLDSFSKNALPGKSSMKDVPISLQDVSSVKSILLDSFPQNTSPIQTSMNSVPISFPDLSSIKNISLDSFPKITSPDSFTKRRLPDFYNYKSTSCISDSKTNISYAPESSTSHMNKISFHVKKNSLFNERSESQSDLKPGYLKDIPKVSSQLKPTKICSPSSILDNAYFCTGIMQDNNRLRDFEFPLVESTPCFRTSFQNDVKSTIVFKMKTGNICLYGFELKVKNDNSKSGEELDIDVDLKGFSKQPFNQLFKKKFMNNILAIRFPEKMMLQENCKGMLEVSIDNLLLNRCSICNTKDKGYELNNGLNFACEISIKSTKESDNGFLFLISKLNYVPC